MDLKIFAPIIAGLMLVSIGSKIVKRRTGKGIALILIGAILFLAGYINI